MLWEGLRVDQDSEATHFYVRAAPGRVFVRLARRADDGTVVRGMHCEFTPAQALKMARYLDERARIAIASGEPESGTPCDILDRLLMPPI